MGAPKKKPQVVPGPSHESCYWDWGIGDWEIGNSVSSLAAQPCFCFLLGWGKLQRFTATKEAAPSAEAT